MFGRSKWTALGAVVAVLAGGGSLLTASAAGSSAASSFVPITPCRLFDTRAGSDNIGPRATPLGPDETHIAHVWGANGNCTVPAGATSVSLGVTVVNPTAASYLTVFPADATRPLASNLNWVAGQAPTPNAVTAPLSADGRMGLYNLAGTVDVLVDVVGYYELSSGGQAGPPGAPGAPGNPGPRPAQVIWVAKSGGDFTSVAAALASITDNSAFNPYVVSVAPGSYDEPGGVALEDYVDIEGSGQTTTIITCACASATTPVTDGSSATVRASGPSLHTELRDLTVANTGTQAWATGIRTGGIGAGQMTIRNVTTTATGSTNNVGVSNVSSSPTMSNVTATASGGTTNFGVTNSFSSPTMTNVTAAGTGGTNNFGVSNTVSTPTMSNVTAIATGDGINFGVFNTTSSPTMTNVTATATGSGNNNFAVNNSSSSPTMTNVTATASGGNNNYGVRSVNSSSPTMSNVNASATGGGANFGVLNVSSSSPTMSGGRAFAGGGSATNIGLQNMTGSQVYDSVTAIGAGGTVARAVVNDSGASVELIGVTAVASGGSLNQNWGVLNRGSATTTVRDSAITGSPNSIANAGGTVRVANTRLSSIAQGTMSCINSYDAMTFVLLNASCQ